MYIVFCVLVAWPVHSLLLELSAQFSLNSVDHAVRALSPVALNIFFLIAPTFIFCLGRLVDMFYLVLNVCCSLSLNITCVCLMNQTLWTYHTEPIVVISIISIICIITTIVIISYHFDIFCTSFFNRFAPNVPFMEKPGSWFVLTKWVLTEEWHFK